jgi:hypothetical protein
MDSTEPSSPPVSSISEVRTSPLRFLFTAAVFIAAFLLFLVEPIAAKQLLPILGGSASVWITCLVFFQTVLLLGYLYAQWLAERHNWIGHIALLVFSSVSAAIWALYGFTMGTGNNHPALIVFVALGTSIGLPFVALAATSPLMQVWWSRAEATPIPWRLYALSNLASLLALGAYPSLVEPYITLREQRIAWACGFVIFAVISVAMTLKARSAAHPSVLAAAQDTEVPVSPLSHKLLWVLLPMGAAMQLCTVTAYLTANVAAIPLLWVLPLGVYLVTLILSFQFRVVLPWSIIARMLVVLLGALAYSLSRTEGGWPLWVSLLFFLGELFFACIFCHSEAVRLRPQRPSEATLFYLLFAAGGALGSFLIGIAAPLLFTYNLDLPITFFVTALLALLVNWRAGWSQRLLWSVASAALIVVTFMVRQSYSHNATVAVRNFYASLRVTQDLFSYPGTTVRTLMNGSIQHGTQIFGTDELRHTPTTYYPRNSGVGLALQDCCQNRPRNVGVIGLGAGTIAAYGRPGDHIRFYDINPAVPPIAQNVFTYIRESAAQVDIVQGDARRSLASEPPQHFDVLVVDAFSGDAIPVHLLTTEAIALYRKHLNPSGILAFHISNRHVDLAPPLVLLAQSAGMEARRISSNTANDPGEYVSTWMLLTADPAFFELPEVAPRAHVVTAKPRLRVWTDDYSALLPVLRW